jgi:hypothetical protein
MLILFLLGVIGYSGYRVYPPLVDLWQRTREMERPTIPPKADSAAPASNPDSANAKPDDQSNGTVQSAEPAPAPTAEPVENSAPKAASQPTAAPAATVKALVAAPATAGSTDKTIAAQKPAAPAGPSPARQLESKLRAELAGQPVLDKVTIQATSNALTLSGSLSLAEHRDLLDHLRAVPTGVRVIDDIELTENSKASPAPAIR